FFQAENGILTRNVTGVQTCALPICGQHKGVALLASILTFALSVPLAAGFRPAARGFSFEQRTDWAPNLGFSYHVGLDGVALLLEIGRSSCRVRGHVQRCVVTVTIRS